MLPASGNNDGVVVVWIKSDGGDPVLVVILLDSVFALGQGIPQLDVLVTDVSGEGDRQNILGTVLKPPGGLDSAEALQSESLFPGARQGKLTIR